MSRPAMGMCFIAEPMTYPSALIRRDGYGDTTGITCVTPSPESMTVPVRDLSWTFEDVHEAARARTA
jgi:hypothetical protein